MNSVGTIVVGAGVIGLAVAAALSADGHNVAVLEAADDIGTQTSSRNSGVIHSGIYYPTGSVKARACVAGRDMLYRYCAERDIAHQRIGKLIVATSPTQLDALRDLAVRAQRNGVDDVQLLNSTEVAELEPGLLAHAALLAPSTGIIDSYGFMHSLRDDAEAAGAIFVLRSRVIAVDVIGPQQFSVTTESETLRCSRLINCAGIGAWDIAHATKGLDAQTIPPRHLAKGSYFGLTTTRTPFRHLVYPVPVDGGLGVHLTLDLAGAARFGPDVQWLSAEEAAVDHLDYGVDPERAQGFYAEIRRYWPGLPDDSLVPSMAGIRPKVSGPGQPAADFGVHDASVHGIDGLITLFGIESPGLTSSLALAQLLAGQAGRR
ncbi:NAD(P)/FAD-dependent oxidoreductase [Gordonia sp. CPCC 205333]|uniref:NAD(P)/FAD-dependent oxidoreductase n=1 Tax=Gordonia sp. CPCC 205333 TaxID=3140790 RepID=UPI003AF3CD47